MKNYTVEGTRTINGTKIVTNYDLKKNKDGVETIYGTNGKRIKDILYDKNKIIEENIFNQNEELWIKITYKGQRRAIEEYYENGILISTINWIEGKYTTKIEE